MAAAAVATSGDDVRIEEDSTSSSSSGIGEMTPFPSSEFCKIWTRSRLPVIMFRFRGVPSEDFPIEAHDDGVKQALGHFDKCCMFIDLRQISWVGLSNIRKLAQLLERITPLIGKHVIGTSVVVGGPLGESIMEAVFELKPPKKPIKIFKAGETEQAIDFVVSLLDDNGVDHS